MDDDVHFVGLVSRDEMAFAEDENPILAGFSVSIGVLIRCLFIKLNSFHMFVFMIFCCGIFQVEKKYHFISEQYES